MAPPSQHGSGSYYEWVDGFSLSEIDSADHVPWTIEYLETYATKAIEPTKETPPKPSKTLSAVDTPATPNQLYGDHGKWRSAGSEKSSGYRAHWSSAWQR